MSSEPVRRPGIWSLPHSLASRRLAQSLASSAQHGELATRRDDLCRLAADDPRRAVDLVLALADLAASSLAPPMPSTDEEYLDLLRKAHAAYERGLRLTWIVEGERDYQREKKRRRRQEQLAERARAG